MEHGTTSDKVYTKRSKSLHCPQCDLCKPNETKVFVYYAKYDCWTCTEHNVWLETPCSDEDGECPFFCTSRPERPYPIK